MFEDFIYIGETNENFVNGKVYALAKMVFHLGSSIQTDYSTPISPDSIVFVEDGLLTCCSNQFISITEFRNKKLDDLEI
jgi:hypothetical protein